MNQNDNAETASAVVVRLIDENGWEWRTVVKVINRSFHTSFSINELKQLYKSAKAATARSGVFRG